MLFDQIEKDLLSAMKEREKQKVSTLRLLKTALKNEMIEKRTEVLADEDALAIVRRMIKQTKDSLVDFEKADRSELIDQAKSELEILEIYMPTAMSEEEVKNIVNVKKVELGTADKSGMGQLMGAVMKEVSGRADGAIVRRFVEESLS
jgi:uncharacterized protein